jgi:hypothetical protein
MFKRHITAQMLTLVGLSLLLAACGGGSTDSANDGDVYGLKTTSVTTGALPQEEKPPQPQSVQLEGCVVDNQWLSAAGAAVHVRSADGRTLGSVYTDARGVFVVKVPARSAIVVATDWAGPGALALRTGNQPLTVAGCLPSGL